MQGYKTPDTSVIPVCGVVHAHVIRESMAQRTMRFHYVGSLRLKRSLLLMPSFAQAGVSLIQVTAASSHIANMGGF
jgi:hypothetical protein